MEFIRLAISLPNFSCEMRDKVRNYRKDLLHCTVSENLKYRDAKVGGR